MDASPRFFGQDISGFGLFLIMNHVTMYVFMSATEIFVYAQVYEHVGLLLVYCNYVSVSGPQARTYSHGHLRR